MMMQYPGAPSDVITNVFPCILAQPCLLPCWAGVNPNPLVVIFLGSEWLKSDVSILHCVLIISSLVQVVCDIR
jgi:hypothetical protein